MICSIFQEADITRRKLVWTVLGIILLGALCWLVWYLLRERGFDWSAFFATITGLHWGWLFASVVAGMAAYLNRALRWAVLMTPVKSRPGLWNLNSATLIGFAAITVFGRPGELVRPYLIAKKEDVSVSSQLAALLLERIYDLLAALLVFGFALSRVQRSTAAVGPALTWVLGMGGRLAAAIGLVCVLILFLIGRYGEKMRQRLIAALGFLPEHLRQRAERLADAFIRGAEATKTTRGAVSLGLYTAVEWVLIAISIATLVRAFGPRLPLGGVDILILMGFIAFGAVIQIPGIGGGFQVVTVLVLTELFGIHLEVATSAAMVLWAVSFLMVVPVGLLLALHEGLSLRKLKDLGQET